MYKLMPLEKNVEEMFIGPFGSSLKSDCFVDKKDGYCMVYEQKHAIQKSMRFFQIPEFHSQLLRRIYD